LAGKAVAIDSNLNIFDMQNRRLSLDKRGEGRARAIFDGDVFHTNVSEDGPAINLHFRKQCLFGLAGTSADKAGGGGGSAKEENGKMLPSCGEKTFLSPDAQMFEVVHREEEEQLLGAASFPPMHDRRPRSSPSPRLPRETFRSSRFFRWEFERRRRNRLRIEEKAISREGKALCVCV